MSAHCRSTAAPLDRGGGRGAGRAERRRRGRRRSSGWCAITTPAGSVLWLDYEAYAPLALKAFEQIAAEAAEQWPGARLAIHHRIGRVAIGEASVVIAAASPHRADAFAACRYAIERVKQIAPIWKHEHFEGGDVWIEGRDRGSGGRRRRGARRWSGRARNGPAVRAAARAGRRVGADARRARRAPPRATRGTRWRRSSRR